MANGSKYPFAQLDIFIISLSIHREQSVPAGVEIPVTAEIKIAEPGFPHLQVNMKLLTPPDKPIRFSIEAVGQFDYIGNQKGYDKELNQEFVKEKALHILWTYLAQLVKLITSQMGMNPLTLRVPLEFGLGEEIRESKS